jgi:hypothetical protein
MYTLTVVLTVAYIADTSGMTDTMDLFDNAIEGAARSLQTGSYDCAAAGQAQPSTKPFQSKKSQGHLNLFVLVCSL